MSKSQRLKHAIQPWLLIKAPFRPIHVTSILVGAWGEVCEYPCPHASRTFSLKFNYLIEFLLILVDA
jgi:hypothetical protein